VFRPGRPLVNLPWRPIGSFNVFGAPVSKSPRGVMVLSPVYVESTWDIG
jgi:hypothetical protein